MIETGPEAIEKAVALLRQGELVAFPTETVYGLGADARNPEALQRLFATKGRPADHPVIVHLLGAEWLPEWAAEIPEAAATLAEQFWPGPLTLILPRAPGVTDWVTGGQTTVGLRAPAHPVAQQLLAAYGSGLAAPSANSFGHISPTRAEHVRSEFTAAQVPLILDGGPCQVGLESTIVDLSGPHPALLRPGGIRVGQIEKAIGRPLTQPTSPKTRAPGGLEKHYAPNTAAWLVEPDRLQHASESAVEMRQQFGVISHAAARVANNQQFLPADAEGYARGLYQAMRVLDAMGLQIILIEAPPDAPEWTAVWDRLRKATLGYLR